jgi:hypothetical protein
MTYVMSIFLESRKIVYFFMWEDANRSGSRMFTSPYVHTSSGDHPTSYPMSTGALGPGVKRPKREADHSPPTSAKVKKTGSMHPLPHTPSCVVFN